MQFLLKLTPLGVSEQIFRVISVDGLADTEHVLSLCNLSFDYANYSDKRLYLPQTKEQRQFLSRYSHPEVKMDRERLGHAGEAFAPWWRETVDLSPYFCLDLTDEDSRRMALRPFGELLEARLLNEYRKEAEADCAELGLSRPLGAAFIYEVHGVQHLVEVLQERDKLSCFVPAALMGQINVSADEDKQELSLMRLEQCIAADSDGADIPVEDLSLNLKECTSRLRALGAMRAEQNINDALMQAGAAPLKFESR